MDTLVRRAYPIALGALIVFSIIEMSTAAFVTAKYNARHNAPDSGVRARVRYCLFVACWTIFTTTLYMIFFYVLPNNIIASTASHFIYLFITWVLWLAAAAAITQTTGGSINCKIDTKFDYCGQLNALQAFAWLSWVWLTFVLLFVLLKGIFSARKGDGVRGQLVDD